MKIKSNSSTDEEVIGILMQCKLFYFWKSLAKGHNFGHFFQYWTQCMQDLIHLFSSKYLKLRNTLKKFNQCFNRCKLSFWIQFKLFLPVPLKVIFNLCNRKSWLIIWQFFGEVTFINQEVLELHRHFDENAMKSHFIYDFLQFTWILNLFLSLIISMY